MTDQPVKTYAIGFEGEDSFYNELPYAAIVARAFGTDHHEIVVRPDVADLLPKLIWHMDEPIADSAFITTYLVSRLAAQSVKVILSGVGGDELFGGYRRYLGDAFGRYYRLLPEAASRQDGCPRYWLDCRETAIRLGRTFFAMQMLLLIPRTYRRLNDTQVTSPCSPPMRARNCRIAAPIGQDRPPS